MSAELAIQNKMKFGTILLFGINCLLGAGIFITPGKAYSLLGVNLFWVLAVCAVMAIIMALAFAEMAGIFTKTAGYIFMPARHGGPLLVLISDLCVFWLPAWLFRFRWRRCRPS